MAGKPTEYSGWGRVRRARGRLYRPELAPDLQRLVAESPHPAIGMRRSYGDACLRDQGAAIDMTRMDRILDFDAETGHLHVQAGARIGELARIFAPQGWMPAVMPGTGFATVGGGIAMDVHGKNHHAAGSFGCHVEELTLMTADGPKVVKSNTKGDLFKATIGGLGQTGPISSAKLRMTRTKGDVVIVTERRIATWEEYIERFEASDASYSVGWIDATARGQSLGRGVLEEGETSGGLAPPAKGSKRIPFDAPSFTLSPSVVRVFNAAYWRRIPQRGRTVVKSLESFFFPLDKIHNWNRLYGKPGFHQFQCVVPVYETEALRGILTEIAKSGLASPLAVLKRMGPGRAGFLSFPMEGYTLAVDFPNRPLAERLIKRLEDRTAEAGGRIYLAKDAMAGPDVIKAMYPEHAAWLKAVTKADPEARYTTDLVSRLNLRSA